MTTKDLGITLFHYNTSCDDIVIAEWSGAFTDIPGLAASIADTKVKDVIGCVRSVTMGDFTRGLLKKRGVFIVTHAESDQSGILPIVFSAAKTPSGFGNNPLHLLPSQNPSISEEFIIGIDASNVPVFTYIRNHNSDASRVSIYGSAGDGPAMSLISGMRAVFMCGR